MFLFYFFSFLFGLCLGSFLNVVAFRYGTGRSAFFSRSGCLHCGKKLSWFELVPLVSFLIQMGKCRGCGKRISFQYPLIEVLGGATLVLIFWKTNFFQSMISGEFLLPFFESLFLIIVFSILIVIGIYDYWHKIIPDGLVFAFIALSFVGQPFLSSFNLGTDFSFYNWDNLQILLWLGSGPLISLPFFSLWFFSGGRWMGFGDVKLGLGIGYFLGIVGGFYAILWSFWIGGLFSITLLFLGALFSGKVFLNSSLFSDSKRFTMKSEVPFGPFMIMGTAIVFFTEWDFLDFLSYLNF